MSWPRSSLARVVPGAPDPQAEMRLRGRAWAELGLLTVKLEECRDDWERQPLRNIARRIFGEWEGR